MTKILVFGMFSFEVHVKLLAGMAATVPLLFMLTALITRVEFHRTGIIPMWIQRLNVGVLSEYENAKKDHTGHQNDPQTQHEYIWSAVSYFYLVFEVFLACLLWKGAKQKNVKKLQIWILCGVILSGIGFLLLESFRNHEILELGLFVVFTKLNLLYSIYTLAVVILLIMKIKMDIPT